MKYVSCQQAIRQAFGYIGYGAEFIQQGKPDLLAWSADAMDLISRLKTYDYYPCSNYDVCDNRVELPNDMSLIICCVHHGKPLRYIRTPGCDNVWKGSANREENGHCGSGGHGFYTDECYMHFKPALPNGSVVSIDGLRRPLDEEGFPMIPEVCVMPIAEYIAWKYCVRFRDNRYGEFKMEWLRHCKWARAELNQLSQADVEALGFLWYKPEYYVTTRPRWVNWMGYVRT